MRQGLGGPQRVGIKAARAVLLRTIARGHTGTVVVSEGAQGCLGVCQLVECHLTCAQWHARLPNEARLRRAAHVQHNLHEVGAPLVLGHHLAHVGRQHLGW